MVFRGHFYKLLIDYVVLGLERKSHAFKLDTLALWIFLIQCQDVYILQAQEWSSTRCLTSSTTKIWNRIIACFREGSLTNTS